MSQTILVLLLIGALATKQITAILMNGSIFAWLRNGIKARAQKSSPKNIHWIFEKLDELIGCALCLTTQVAFWFCVLPATLYLHPNLSIIFTLTTMFIATMAISGLAMILQNLSEFLARAD